VRHRTYRHAKQADAASIGGTIAISLIELMNTVASLTAIVDSVPTALVMVGADGNMAFVNRETERLFGYSRDELIGKPVEILVPSSLRADHPGHRAAFFSNARTRPMGAGRGLHGLHKDGTEFPVEIGLNPISTEGGLFVVSAIVDMTERNRQNEAQRQSTDALQRSYLELTALNRELEAFSYSVSHDLRAPLRSMDGFSLALLEDYGDKLDDEGKDFLNRIRASSQRMGHLIDDLLRLSRVTRTELKLQPVNLSDIARDIASSLDLQPKGHKVRWLIADQVTMHADPNLMRIAMQNLLENAWKFTGKTPTATIRVGMQERDGLPVFFVADNGAGFDMAYADHLFGAFQRLHHADDFSGTGIGLAIVQRIIGRHNGTLWAEASEGKGATFFFTVGEPAK
jgi:PAS domain S-box-containing protein